MGGPVDGYSVISRIISFKIGETTKPLKYSSNITLCDIIYRHNKNEDGFMHDLTEYVIYTAVSKDPTILRIGEDNILFSNRRLFK